MNLKNYTSGVPVSNSLMRIEKRHAKFMVDFLKIYKHTAHEKYNHWLKEYKRLKELTNPKLQWKQKNITRRSR